MDKDKCGVEGKGKNRTAAGDGDLRVLAEFLERERGGGAV